MVTLNPQLNQALTELAKSQHGKDLLAVIDQYILALKDDCVFGTLERPAAQAAIGKLTELKDRLQTLAGIKPPSPKNQFV